MTIQESDKMVKGMAFDYIRPNPDNPINQETGIYNVVLSSEDQGKIRRHLIQYKYSDLYPPFQPAIGVVFAQRSLVEDVLTQKKKEGYILDIDEKIGYFGNDGWHLFERSQEDKKRTARIIGKLIDQGAFYYCLSAAVGHTDISSSIENKGIQIRVQLSSAPKASIEAFVNSEWDRAQSGMPKVDDLLLPFINPNSIVEIYDCIPSKERTKRLSIAASDFINGVQDWRQLLVEKRKDLIAELKRGMAEYIQERRTTYYHDQEY